MFKQTVRLVIKALIIGVLLSVSLQQVSGEPLSSPDKRNPIKPIGLPLSQPTTDHTASSPAWAEN